MQLQLKGLFAIDTFSLLLFAMVILGVVDHLPTATNIFIQTLFIGVTLLLTAFFARRRMVGMVMLKLGMLLALYFVDALTLVG